jgi:hypothetical protein
MAMKISKTQMETWTVFLEFYCFPARRNWSLEKSSVEKDEFFRSHRGTSENNDYIAYCITYRVSI